MFYTQVSSALRQRRQEEDGSEEFDPSPPLQEESPSGVESFFQIAAFVVPIAFVLLLAVIAHVYKCKNCEEATRDENDETSENNGAEDALEASASRTQATQISRMNNEERIELYNEAFDRNKNQIVLEASRIIVNSERSTKTSEEDSEEATLDEEEDPSIYLALEDARARRRSTRVGSLVGMEALAVKGRRRRSSLIHPRCSLVGAAPKTSSLSFSNQTVRGNCVICFEDMQAGEWVVWSESKSCPHVYHKDCIVAFLAHRTQSIEQIELDRNPCPTCREKFVTIITPGGGTQKTKDSTDEENDGANEEGETIEEEEEASAADDSNEDGGVDEEDANTEGNSN